MKRADPFYLSKTWRALRALVLKRDGYRCVICKADVSAKGAARVDHIKPRSTHKHLELDPSNLRVLCSRCDAQSHRERPRGLGGGPREERIQVVGSTATGWPVDPTHPWNRS